MRTQDKKWVVGGAIVLVVLFIFLTVVADSLSTKPPVSKQAISSAPAPFMPSSYQKRFCDERHPVNVKDEADDITINLSEGCFSGPVQIPIHWRDYEEDKSQHEGDWAAVWCDGRTQPSVVHPYTEDFSGEFKRCGKFYLQGRGTIHFTRTTSQ